MSCGNLDKRGVWGKMDTCICMAEFLYCSPETTTQLLLSYIPIQSKKFKLWVKKKVKNRFFYFSYPLLIFPLFSEFFLYLHCQYIEILHTTHYLLYNHNLASDLNCNFSLFTFNWRIALQCCIGFCHTSTWISHKYTYVPSLLILWSSFPLPTPSHPSRLYRAPDLSSLWYTVNFHWLSVLHVVMYIFLCYYLNSSHPLLPPLCTQVCSLCPHLHLSLFSHSVVSHSLRPHELQHNRLPCPSPYPGVCSNSCPLSRWCHPTISSLSSPSSPAFNLSQHQGLFQWVRPLHQVAKTLEFQLQHQCFHWIFRVHFL